MNYPFKVGDKIFHKQYGKTAKVIELTEKGFIYEFDEIFHAHPRLGLSYTGGECFELGFDSFEIFNGENKMSFPKMEFYKNGVLQNK